MSMNLFPDRRISLNDVLINCIEQARNTHLVLEIGDLEVRSLLFGAEPFFL